MSLRTDGEVTFFLVQHLDPRGEWVDSALDHMLFDGLTFEQREAGGDPGDRYRELLSHQSASTPLWQKFGVHGFVDWSDARRALDAVRERRHHQAFRIVRRTIKQETEVQGEPR